MEPSSAVRWTYRDLQPIPETNAVRYEILDGHLYVTPAARLNHQLVATNLTTLMYSLAEERGLGEVVGHVDVVVRQDMLFVPDLIFIRAERMGIADPEGAVHGVPDLVIEILSPSTRRYDRELKRRHYLESGVAELWLIDIDAREIEVWRPAADEPTIARDAIEWRVGDDTFELPFAEIFRAV